MLVQSRAWSVVASVALIAGLCGNPLVTNAAQHLFNSPTYSDDLPLVMVDPDTVRFGANGFPEWVVSSWRGRIGALHAFYAVQNWHPDMGLHGERIPPEMMDAIGAKPWRGRTLRPDDYRSAVVSYEWAHGDASRLGQMALLGREKYRVVGIMQPGFRLIASDAQVWILLPRFADRVQMVALLNPGKSIGEAQRELRDMVHGQKLHWMWNLELITLHHNRVRNILFAIDMLKWNFGFVLFISIGGLARFLLQRRRSVTLRQHLSFLGFLLSRVVLLLGGFGLVWVVVMDRNVQGVFMDGSNFTLPAFSWTFLLASWGATFWCLRDQQHRCRVCFDPLCMPVNSGRWSSLVLDRPRTEYICPFGHGTLYVPGTRLLDIDAVNWRSHDDIWHELFEESVS